MRLGRELRTARRGAGLSLRSAAAAVGTDPSSLARLERGEFRGASLERLAVAFAAVGLRLTARAYPVADPVRDAGQLRVLDRVRGRLPAGAPWATEVTLPIPGDRRAFDAATTLSGARIFFEAETRLDDIQALERRLALKIRDNGGAPTILVVADTHHNRRVLALHRESLRQLFPLDSRAVLSALARGVAPARNGIVVI